MINGLKVWPMPKWTWSSNTRNHQKQNYWKSLKSKLSNTVTILTEMFRRFPKEVCQPMIFWAIKPLQNIFYKRWGTKYLPQVHGLPKWTTLKWATSKKYYFEWVLMNKLNWLYTYIAHTHTLFTFVQTQAHVTQSRICTGLTPLTWSNQPSQQLSKANLFKWVLRYKYCWSARFKMSVWDAAYIYM